jgi:hypothetical protein
MRDDIDHLRQVDHHQATGVHEQVVGRQVAVREPVTGERAERLTKLRPEIRQVAAVGTGLRQPRRGGAVGVADELEQHLGPGDLHRVGDGHPRLVEQAERGELGARPHPGDRLPTERGPVGGGPAHPGIPGPAALQVPRVPMEEPVLGVAVPFRGQQAGLAAGDRDGPPDQENVGFLAGLDDAKLGVNGGEIGDQPLGMRPGPALGRRGLVPGGPAFAVGQAVGRVGRGLRRGQPLDVPVTLGERLLVVEPVTLPLVVCLADPAEGRIVGIRAVAHWWSSSGGLRSGKAGQSPRRAYSSGPPSAWPAPERPTPT